MQTVEKIPATNIPEGVIGRVKFDLLIRYGADYAIIKVAKIDDVVNQLHNRDFQGFRLSAKKYP